MTEAEALTRALGGLWRNGSGMARCPAHDDRTPSLSIKAGEGGRLLLRCFAGCGFEEILEAARGRGLLQPGCHHPNPEAVSARDFAQEREKARKSAEARAIWEATEPLPGTPAEIYLRGRGIFCALPHTLRFHRACPHLEGGRAPALVARIDDGERFAIHQIFLQPDGNGKATLAAPKTTRGAMKGGAVRLTSGSETALAVGEGIETMLSLRCGLLDGEPEIWAALTANNLKVLRLPPARGRMLIIATDGGDTGRNAGDALGERAYAEGWRVFLLPAPDRKDWNEVLQDRIAQP